MHCRTRAQEQTHQAQKFLKTYDAFAQNKWAAPFADPRATRKKQILITDANFLLNTPLYMRPDLELTNSIIHGIDLVPNSVVPSFGGVDMPASYNQGLFIIRDQCEDNIVTIPLGDLDAFNNGRKVQGFYIVRPQWNECHLLLTGGALSAANGILMYVYYTPLK